MVGLQFIHIIPEQNFKGILNPTDLLHKNDLCI